MALNVDNVNYDPFDQAIPGQGMTAEPGSRVWESPSQFSKPEEAAGYVIDKIENNEQAKDGILNIIAAGSPIETIVNTMAFVGFTEGKWTPDTAELIKVPLAVYLVGLAVENNIEATMYNVAKEDQETMNESDLYRMMASNRPEEFSNLKRNLEEQSMASMNEEDMDVSSPEVDNIMENLPQDEGGFMPRRGAV